MEHNKEQQTYSQLEVLEVLQSDTSMDTRRLWLKGALDTLQNDFKDSEDINEKVKIIKTIEDHIKSYEKSPTYFIKLIKNMDNQQLRAFIAITEENKLLEKAKKQTTERAFR